MLEKGSIFFKNIKSWEVKFENYQSVEDSSFLSRISSDFMVSCSGKYGPASGSRK